MDDGQIVLEAADALRRRVDTSPTAALVLGSGLGEVADSVLNATVVPTREIDGYPISTIPGHQGRLVFGHLEGVSVVIVQGRVHLYEGYSTARVAFPMRLVHALGVRRVVLTNAAGAINPALNPGSLMLITDHINFTGEQVVQPPDREADLGIPVACRSIGGSTPYSKEWVGQAERASLDEGIATRCGTYLWTRGPSYETKAEIAAFRRIGADAVGMSTAPEAVQAATLGMDVLGISTITNFAAGLSTKALSHEDVLRVGRMVRKDLERLVRAILGTL